MTFPKIAFTACLTLGLTMALPEPAKAVKGYTCACTAEKDHSCTCSHSYTLGKSATQEFRGTCSEMDKDGVWPDIEVTNRDGGTSCTIQLNISASPDYTTKSCTNWDPFSRDSITVKLKCTNSDGTIYPPASSP